MDDSSYFVSMPKHFPKHTEHPFVKRNSENINQTCESAINQIFQNLPKQGYQSNRSETSVSSLDSKLTQFYNTNQFSFEFQNQPQSSDGGSRDFCRAPGSNEDYRFGETFSNSSSPESPCLSLYSYTNFMQKNNSVCTPMERSPFEEKCLFRESILLGCDLISELGEKMPLVAEHQKHANYLKDKTMQSKAQNVCSKMTVDITESMVVAEYVKTFLGIADTWLDARNCFGLSDRYCTTLCKLDTPELPVNYTEWMHFSRLLMNSIVSGLEKVHKFYRKDNLIRNVVDDKMNHPNATQSYPGGTWGYPPNPPCQCACISNSDEQLKYLPPQVPSDPTLWYPIQTNNVIQENNICEKLKPSSYDVPRISATAVTKKHNISKTQLKIILKSGRDNGYLIDVPVVGDKDEEESKEASVSYENDDIARNVLLKRGERTMNWMANKLNPGKQGEVSEEENYVSNIPIQTVKISKNTHCNQVKSVATITHAQKIRMQAFIHALSEKKLLSYINNSNDPEKQCLSLEKISDKIMSNVYQTVDHFVHDCRQLLNNISQKSKPDKEIGRLNSIFDKLLKKFFDKYPDWVSLEDSTEL